MPSIRDEIFKILGYVPKSACQSTTFEPTTIKDRIFLMLGYIPESQCIPITPTPPPSQQYTITFTESGLPSGTSWSVTFNNQTQTSSTDSITFTSPNGTYNYTIGSVSGYSSLPSSGTVTVNNANEIINISFIILSYH